MPGTTERKTLNNEILKRLDEHSVTLNSLSLSLQLFIQKQEGEHCNINTKLDEIHAEVFGNGGKQRLREMVTRLWEDKQANKVFYLAVAICVISSILNVVLR